jgi:hypothetical protein
MQAYRTHVKITDPEQVTFAHLPFRPGQYVEVLFLAQDETQPAAAQQLEALFKETQSSPLLQDITEEDIAAEIAAYRRELCES